MMRLGRAAAGPGRCGVPVRWQAAARSAGVLAAGRWQGNGQLPEQLLAADRLAVGDGECVDGGEGVVDHDGHGAEDEPFVVVAVGADEIDDAAQVSGPLPAMISSAVLAASVSLACKSLVMLSSPGVLPGWQSGLGRLCH